MRGAREIRLASYLAQQAALRNGHKADPEDESEMFLELQLRSEVNEFLKAKREEGPTRVAEELGDLIWTAVMNAIKSGALDMAKPVHKGRIEIDDE